MISVLVDTYNHEGFIRTAIESVLRQSWFRDHADHEIVVVDDGSTDRTPEVLAEFGDAIRVVRKVNGGQASAFNLGLEHCSGDIVMFLDGDDWWHEDKVALVAQAFAAHPECVAIGHGIIVRDSEGSFEERLPPLGDDVVLNLGSDAGVRPFHDHMSLLGTSRLAARREALDRVGRPPDPLTYEADEYFFTLLPAIGDVRLLPQLLTYYRMHGANLYQSAIAPSDAQAQAKLAKRAQVFRCLADTLPGRLAALGIPAARALDIVEPLALETCRLELATAGGRRSQTLSVERRRREWLASRGVRTRLPVRLATFAAALLLPPRAFYSLRTRYSGSRMRGLLNAESPATPPSPQQEPA